jgi:hypothetical protein
MATSMCPDCCQVVPFAHECKPISKEEREARMRETFYVMTHKEWHDLWGETAEVPPLKRMTPTSAKGPACAISSGRYSPATYVALMTLLVERAHECGYALGLHGSISRDLDLIAVPWVPSPSAGATQLVRELAACIGVVNDVYIHGPEVKPHGRLAWKIALGGGAAIDIGVVPGNVPDVHESPEIKTTLVGEFPVPSTAVEIPADTVVRGPEQ